MLRTPSSIHPAVIASVSAVADDETSLVAGAIAAAMQFRMDGVLKRYAHEQQIPWDIVLEHERELKRFLVIAATSDEQPVGMRGAVDELWHTFIAFTRDYHAFSAKVAGHYIHHSPSTEGSDPADAQKAYEFFWERYTAVFGEHPPIHIWPKPSADYPVFTGCTS